jgi:predicted Zn-dependent peptidase
MKKIALLLFAFVLGLSPLVAQDFRTEEKKSPDGKYTYTTVINDLLKARIYVLPNGLTVMMSVNKNEPRLQTMIATKAGSKNDPADKTGLAHYLEHMLFKGTDKFGSKDFPKEKEQLDKIEALYETYNHTTGDSARKSIYHQIDSVSGVAAQFAIANEYDKLLGSIGATGTNAFTSFEETVYVNDIPKNELEKWLQIEGERFRNPILRLFHTELEAVYEEKNRGLDNDSRKVYEAMFAGLFKHHTYGTQTTIGTVEHLKNPSLTKIKAYYDTYYVPNNMAVIIAGDFNPDEAIVLIDKYFGYMKPKPVPPYTFTPEEPRTTPEVVTVTGPSPESVQIGFRMAGADSKDARVMEVADALLSYKSAGLIDLNLKKTQKVLDASSGYEMLKDYCTYILDGHPKTGQSLDEVKNLLLDQLTLLKKGEFDEATLKAVVSNLTVDRIKRYESNEGRASTLLEAFVLGENWKDYASRLETLSKITKPEVVAFANKYFQNDYVVVYKKTGEDTTVKKVPKPPITPVEVNRDAQSDFLKTIQAETVPPIKPVFIDYKTDISTAALKHNVPVYYLANTENKLFSLYYVLDMGKNNDRKLPFAVNYLQYLGTNKYSAQQISKEFFKLACEFNVSAGDDRVYVSLSGLDENFDAAVKLFEELLANVKPDQEALDNMVALELKGRADAKLNKRVIHQQAMRSYAAYGKKNPFTDKLSEAGLKALKAADLTAIIKSLTSYQHKVLYYGPKPQAALTASLNKYHKTPAKLKAYPAATEYPRLAMTENVVYFVNYNMVQAEVMWLNKSENFNPVLIPIASMFNEYFGGNMSSIVFQTIRESKALAYSTFSQYTTPQKKTDPFYVMAYVGTQADKINEAIPAMNDLLNTLPKADQLFVTAKDGLKNQIETERILKADILFNYLAAQKRGLDYDVRKDVYAYLNTVTFEDLQKFHDTEFKNKPYAYCIIASKDRVKPEDLAKYGKVVELSLEDVFGY